MTDTRGAAWRAAEYLGLVTDKPKPKFGTGRWWLAMLGIAVVALVAVSAVGALD